MGKGNKRLLIINGSPRKDGDTGFLLEEMKKRLDCETEELSAFYGRLSPCLDCRGCSKSAKCVLSDDMSLIYEDSFDSILLACPVYFGTLPGPVLNIISRLQPLYYSKYVLNASTALREKRAGLILTAGGQGNEEGAVRLSKTLFKFLNAKWTSDNFVMSLNTDTLPAADDKEALSRISELAKWLSRELAE